MASRLNATSVARGAYCYRLGTSTDVFWHFDDAGVWASDFGDGNATRKISNQCAKKLLEYRDDLLSSIQLQIPLHSTASEPVDWLASTRRHDQRVRGPTSVMLNTACRHESFEKFRIVSTFVGPYVTVDMQGVRPGEPRWFFHNFESNVHVLTGVFLSFPGMFGKVSRSGTFALKLVGVKELKSIAQRLTSHRVEQTFAITKYDRTATVAGTVLKVHLEMRSELCEYERGRICWSLPIPGTPTIEARPRALGDIGGAPTVVVRSPRVVESLTQLSRIWQDRFLSTVLITAPPGSGKEQYAGSIPFGNGRAGKGFPFHTISLAAGDQSALERQLFGAQRADGSISAGLIAKSSRGTLFLDEVHHPDDKSGIRAALLRVLENNSYFPVGSADEARVEDVLFVLATSRRMSNRENGSSGIALDRIPPTDFWTRMAHILELPHPLEDLDSDDMAATVGCFFKHFWWDRVSKTLGVAPFADGPEDSTSLVLRREQAHELMKENVLEAAAGVFAEAFSKNLRKCRYDPARVSIRGIRSMVSRVVSLAANGVLSGETWFAKHAFAQACSEAIRDVLPLAIIRAASGNPDQKQ